MSEPPFDVSQAQRWFAVECNNRTWDLLEKADRSPAETDDMVHSAHAACFHWLRVGKPINHVRALCTIAQAHATAGDGGAALRYALATQTLAESIQPEVADWDWAFITDALARSHAAAGAMPEARRFRQEAQTLGEKITDDEDRKIFQGYFAVWPWNE